jgi:hypothetical protein
MTPIDHTLRALRLAGLGLEQSGGSLWHDGQEVALFVQNAVAVAVGDGLIDADLTLAAPGRELLGRLNRGYTASLDAMGWTRAQFEHCEVGR